MSYENNLVQPTIQHNIPISKGGKHEIGNISVVCRSCNTSIRDNQTESLNADEVAKAWDEISCIHSVSKMDTEDRLGKYRLGKVSINNHICADSVANATQENAEFIAFWEKYPKKYDKHKALKAFEKVCKCEDDFNAIMDGLTKWLEVWKNKDPQYIPYPTTWINNRRWEANIEAEKKGEEYHLPFE